MRFTGRQWAGETAVQEGSPWLAVHNPVGESSPVHSHSCKQPLGTLCHQHSKIKCLITVLKDKSTRRTDEKATRPT